MFTKIAFIGAGSMAEAILTGLIHKQVIQCEQVFVTNRNNEERLHELKERYGVTVSYDKKRVMEDADVVILSMKPYDVDDGIATIKPYIQSDQLVLSVLAGTSIERISSSIGADIPIIRAMPNTSAAIGLSATALAKGTAVTKKHEQMSEKLFETIGITSFIEEEEMHIITSISGSGPAYFYYLVEIMEKAAIDSGLDPELASAFIAQTIVGAGHMLQQDGAEAAVLRKNITSPQGTTEAGLRALDEYQFTEAVTACVERARDRSIELGK